MDPEVLAQHQIEEIRKLVVVYTKWRESCIKSLAGFPEDALYRVSTAQTAWILAAAIQDLNKILDQI
jgi:hypothetical protein